MSYLVQARSKSHALNRARFHMNDETISLDRLKLVNRMGMEKWMKVERVESILWAAAESSDFSNQFKVIGHIQLVVRIHASGDSAESVLQEPYHFPRTLLSDKTVWVIPTLLEPAFTQVLNVSFTRSAGSRESASLIIAV
ncbi:hypothetical protein GCM10010911_14600 [Paenibacillus nasutitermitis]|uniref:Uncharacterized protein n=1 Tax=Paenibacillus nasutitermitis TaxID=1652958 RepID=A0A916YSJ2_9BACL|nr:hypothetical protein GCM10010911_14600 [Paenibacillus nasutitermitis]